MTGQPLWLISVDMPHEMPTNSTLHSNDQIVIKMKCDGTVSTFYVTLNCLATLYAIAPCTVQPWP